jgi:hypothetical protein
MRFVAVQSTLWAKLRAEYKANPAKFQAPGELEKWIGTELKGVRAGGSVDQLNAAPPVMAPGLFPTGPLPGPDDLNAFLK